MYIASPLWLRARPPLPIIAYIHVRTHLGQKGVFFQREAWIREIKKKESLFRHKSAKFWKRVKILPVIIRGFVYYTWDEYLNTRSRLNVLKNTMYIEKCLTQVISLSQKDTISYLKKIKNKILLWRRLFYWTLNNRFRLKMKCFFVRNPRNWCFF